jgi:hypothetical protein
VIDGSNASPQFSYVVSSRVLIDKNDIFQMNMSFRWRNNFSQNHAVGVAAVYLYGDDGSFWVLRCVNDNQTFIDSGNVAFKTEWVQANSTFRVAGNSTIYIQTGDLTGIDLNQWNAITVNNTRPAHAPVNGSVEVIIVNQYPTDGAEMWFKDVRVTILPYLLGGYAEVKGDYNYSASHNDVKQTMSDEVNISDSPKRYFKGALLDSGHSVLAPDWHRLGISEHGRFAQLMERLLFNHLYKMLQKIEGTFKGFIYTDENFDERQAGLLNNYVFIDSEDPTKKYMLTSYEKNLATGKGRHVFVECVEDQNTDPFVDPSNPDVGTYKFQYLFK